jgi:hypothetical protein
MLGKTVMDSGRLSRRFISLVLLVALISVAGTAQALDWCGENGVIRLSFEEGKSTANIHHAETENGVTKVIVVAWLTDVDSVSLDGKVFDTLGGFELDLKISGARGFILNKKIMGKGINVSQRKGGFIAGLAFGFPLVEGKVALAQWEVMFQGEVQDVMFSLDAEGLHSCRTSPGCPESAPQAIYIGAGDSTQSSDLFGAGYIPAWLNPTTDPDLTPITGSTTWLDVGRYQKAEQ